MKRRTKIFLAVTLTLLVLVGLAWLWNEDTKTALAEAQARCRDAGMPMTIEALRPPVPDADNADLVMEKIRPLVEQLNLNPKDNQFTGNFFQYHQLTRPQAAYRLDAEGTKEVEAMLQIPPIGEVMALLKEAVAKKGHAPLEKDESLLMSYREKGAFLPGLGMDAEEKTYGFCLQMISWQVRLAISRGQADEACAYVWEMTELAEFFADEPMMGAQVTRVDSWALALRELERLAATGCLTPEWNQKFAERLAGLNLTQGFVRALDGKRVIETQHFFADWLEGKNFEGQSLPSRLQEIEDGHISDDRGWKERLENPLQIFSNRIPGVIRLAYAAELDQAREQRGIIARAAATFGTIRDEMTETSRTWLPQLNGFTMFIDAEGRLRYAYSEHTGEAPESLVEMFCDARARTISAQVGLALERYRQAKGGYPAALAALVPDFLPKVPADIFSGKPLVYRSEPDGALVYSVGKNLVDNGGLWVQFDFDHDDQGWAAGSATGRRFDPTRADDNYWYDEAAWGRWFKLPPEPPEPTGEGKP